MSDKPTIDPRELHNELCKLSGMTEHEAGLEWVIRTREAEWMEVFRKRCEREHEMIGEAIDDFCDAVLAKLKDLGVPETDNCDGDDDVETIFAGWIHARILDSPAGRAAGAGGVGENASPKEATDNDPSSATLGGSK